MLWGHQEAGGLIDVAELEARAEGRSLLVLKATSALPRDMVERDVLGRSGMRAVFVVRRSIDTYVSLVKATALNAWRDTDLTSVRVKLDAEQFLKWMAAEDAWYAHWKGWLERRAFPLPILRYETHILSVPPESVLRRFAATVAQVGLTLKVPAALPFAGLVRQGPREGGGAQGQELARLLARADRARHREAGVWVSPLAVLRY